MHWEVGQSAPGMEGTIPRPEVLRAGCCGVNGERFWDSKRDDGAETRQRQAGLRNGRAGSAEGWRETEDAAPRSSAGSGQGSPSVGVLGTRGPKAGNLHRLYLHRLYLLGPTSCASARTGYADT